MTIFVTGSLGKTSRRLALQLREKQQGVLIGGRSGKGLEDIPGVKFDWTDASTYENVFQHAQAQSSPITAVYLVAPEGYMDVLSIMQPFLEALQAKGVRRFVLLSASAVDADAPFIGAVHKYLRDSGVEYAVLRPSWFMQNFSELGHMYTIRNESKIYSAAADGKVPFVSAEDIAASAAAALTREKSYNDDFIIIGPESITYDELANTFTQVLGRDIVHVKVSEEERKDRYIQDGVDAGFAAMLASLDTVIANGKENHSNNNVEQLTGHKPIAFKAFIEKHKQVWLKE